MIRMNEDRDTRFMMKFGTLEVLVTVTSVGCGFVSGGMGIPSLAQIRGDLKWWFAISSFWNV